MREAAAKVATCLPALRHPLLRVPPCLLGLACDETPSHAERSGLLAAARTRACEARTSQVI